MPTKPIQDEYAQAGDLNLHYVQWGQNGTPVVCIHGLTANAFFFQALADTLSTDHRVIAYDLRGRGDSDHPEHGYSVPIHAADLAALLDTLQIEKPVLVGHSLGAFIALYFAAHYPDRLSKLVLVDAGTSLPWQRPEDQPAWLTASVGRLGIPVPSFTEYIQRLKSIPFLGPYWNEYCDIYFEHDVNHNSDGSVISKCYRDGLLEELRLDEAQPEQQWAHVQVPTLLVRAGQSLFLDNDQLVPETAAAIALQTIKDGRYANFPSLNHYTILFGVEPGPAKEIQAFVDGHKPQ